MFAVGCGFVTDQDPFAEFGKDTDDHVVRRHVLQIDRHEILRIWLARERL